MRITRALVIDFAAAAPRCGIVERGTLVWRELEPNPDDSRGRMLYHALEALVPAGDWATLDALACVTGPGPMTGLRVGVAATIGLARGARLPVVPLTGWHLRVDPGIVGEQEVRFAIGRAGWSRGVVDTARPGWPVVSCVFERDGEREDPLRDDAVLAALSAIPPVDAAELRPIYLRPASADPQFDVFGRPLATQGAA